MKLFRFRKDGRVCPGVFTEGQHLDLSTHFRDIDPGFIENIDLSKIDNLVKDNRLPMLTNPDFDAPVGQPGKIICIGLNYLKHARESGMEVPKEPVVFFKATSSLCGPFDKIVIPKNSQKTDWEVELAVVIGKRANYVERDMAMDYVAGYTLHNDVSEREFQLERGGQWVKGKSCDSFAPMGPYLVTKDEIPNPHNLDLWLSLNGKKVQDGNTSDFIFDIPTVVSYLSQFMSLMPGDIISTGTPEGVGLGFKPPVYLKPGDVVELGVEGLGTARQEVVAWAP